MRSLLLLNDVHLGVKRSAGTTPASAEALRASLQQAFEDTIYKHLDKDLCIVGDLFDAFEVEIEDVLKCYFALSKWLQWMNNGRMLYLVAGNHDIGKRNDKLSSFDVLAQILVDAFPDRVVVIREGLETVRGDLNVHAIPHCMNQDLFNIEMEKALSAAPGYLLLHANVDNGFAENSDHSLNVDAEWLTRLSKKHTLLFAHEHQHRIMHYDHNSIIMMGNQWPSSVADCLAHGDAQRDGRKLAHVITPENGIEVIETWQRNGDFIEMDWTDIKDVTERFVRVTGTASAAQASDVISAIARYRAKSPAFVIANGVKVDGVQGMDDLAEVSFGQVKSFDVLKALLELLEPEEANVVRELLEVA